MGLQKKPHQDRLRPKKRFCNTFLIVMNSFRFWMSERVFISLLFLINFLLDMEIIVDRFFSALSILLCFLT